MQNTLKRLLVLIGVGSLCAFVLRMIEIVAITEHDTGFFSRGYSAFGTAISIIIFVIILSSFIYSIGTRRQASNSPKMTKGFAIVNILLAIAIVYEALFAKVAVLVPTWQLILQIVCGLLSAIIFIYKAYTAWSGKNALAVADVIIVVFWLVRLVVVFASYMSVSAISEHIFETAALCSVLVYFLTISEYANGFEKEKIKTRILPVSVVTFMLCAVHALPQLALLITGNANMLHSDVVTYVTDCVLLVFIPYYAVLCHKEPKEQEHQEQEIIETL